MTEQTATEQPQIEAVLNGGGTATVSIDGVAQSINAADDTAARREAMATVAKHAAELGRAVKVTTVDANGKDAIYVSPDGSLSTNAPGQHAAPAPVPEVQPEPAPQATPLPTLNDFLATRPATPSGPAEEGWQGTVRKLTAGLIKPAPGRLEIRHREAVTAVQRSLSGPRTIAVLNPKGGAHKTTGTLKLAQAFGTLRGGYTLAWDNNETRGTLGWRATQARHSNTAVNLLHDLERFTDPARSRVGDLDNYVRSQGSAQFDVLASDEDAASAASIDAEAFHELHKTLSRFYRVIVVDTGNNMRASNWQAAVEAADQLVIISTVREDTAASAAWLVDGLRAMGHEDKVHNAVSLLCSPAATADPQLLRRLKGHFGALTREVLEIPHDPALVSGGPINFDALSDKTNEAWLFAAAAVSDGL